MFYEAVDSQHRHSIGMAVSQDGRSGWQCSDRYDCRWLQDAVCEHIALPTRGLGNTPLHLEMIAVSHAVGSGRSMLGP